MKCWMQWTKAKLGKEECVWRWPVWWLTWQRNLNHQECSRFQGFKKSQEIIWGSQTQKLKTWSELMCAMLLTFTERQSNLTFSWEKLLLPCYLLFALLLQPAPGGHSFLPTASSFIWGHPMRPWSTSDLHGCFHPWIASLGEAFSTKPGAHKLW